jgi:putative spermidine/putrescine transport system ATP-binding protein
VGQLNVLPATVVDGANGRLTLYDQTIYLLEPVEAAAGTAVNLALRPEELSLHGDDSHNQLTGTLEEASFLGAIVRLRLKIGATLILADLFNERQLILPKIGETVTLYFPRHACWLL